VNEKDPKGKTDYSKTLGDFPREENNYDSVGISQDLTQRKELLENIMESSIDGIVTTDLRGKMTYMNRAMLEMLGYRSEELLGKHISSLYFRGIQEAWDIMDLLSADGRIENYEMQVKDKKGEVLTIRVSASLLHDGEGKSVGTLGIFKNISEQKHLEAKLKESQFYLVEASKLRALGELVTGVVHELNNPLMASRAIFHVVLNTLPPEDSNRERLELVSRCFDRIEKLVNYLRGFSHQAESDFREMAAQPLMEDESDLPKNLGDSSRLEQVMMNLISNARQAIARMPGSKELQIHSYLEEALKSEKIIKEDLLEDIPVPTFVLDRDHRVVFWNRACAELTGYSREEMVGTTDAWKPFYAEPQPILGDLILNGDLSQLSLFYGGKNLRASLLVKGAFEAEDFFETEEGKSIYLFLLAAPIYDKNGRLWGVIETIQDLTDRKLLESELSGAEREAHEKG
jgi:PAS domain S-box-containing protein